MADNHAVERRWRVVLFLLAVLAAASPAAGQRAILGYAPQLFQPPVIEAWDLGAGTVEWSEPGILDIAPVFTSDGRYLVSRMADGSTTGLRVLDVVTRQWLRLPIDFRPLVAHPTRTEVFGLLYEVPSVGGTLARLDPSGLTLYGGCAAGMTRAFDLGADGVLGLALCATGDLVVLDAATGSERRRIAVGPSYQVVASADGSRAIVVRGTARSDGDIALVDTTNGAVQASTVFPDANPYPGYALDCRPGHLLGASRDRRTVLSTCVWLYDLMPGPILTRYLTRSLDAVSLTWGPDLGVLYGALSATISPDRATVYVMSLDFRGPAAFQAVTLATGDTLGSVRGAGYGLAVAFPPLPPSLAASSDGRRVDFQWTSPAASPAATAYRLEVGSAPGLTNLVTIPLAAQTGYAVPDVPPGRYYVRLRAVNATGASAPSNELLIDVP